MDKLVFLTWNIKQNRKATFFKVLNDILQEKSVDFLVLQECNDITYLDKQFIEVTYPALGEQRWVRIFFRKNRNINYQEPSSYLFNKLLFTEFYISDQCIFSLGGVHLYSARGKSSKQQANQHADLPKLIMEYELRQGHDQTLLVGDFNYNPFDKQMNDPAFLNAVGSRNIIRNFRNLAGNRHQRHTFPFFYNPMWNKLGDYDTQRNQEAVPGTYYWNAKDAEHYYWNMLDGVLLRPSIMDALDGSSLEIITQTTLHSLVRKSIQYDDQSFLIAGFSDHLPLTFTLDASLLSI